MLRLDVEYDVLPRESVILHLNFWASAFELLKRRFPQMETLAVPLEAFQDGANSVS